MTASQLHEAIVAAGCEPEIIDDELVMLDPPPKLSPYIPILTTGLRAILTGRTWCCIDANGRGAVRPDGTLLPTELLPSNAHLLDCWDGLWDRIDPHWLEEYPELFRVVPDKKGGRK